MQGRRFLIAACVAVIGSNAVAQEGDPQAASNKISMCQGCHGIPGYRNAFPQVYQVPKLGGQHREYIVSALQAYRNGEREHATMQAIARGLTDKDIADIATYYGTRAQEGKQ